MELIYSNNSHLPQVDNQISPTSLRRANQAHEV